ncbi:MAG TPA: HAD-IIA family hydrolase [Anaerolineae bacterium]|nr:HAD-IIA family hydrolase [Anaerolineae bacterium]
MTIQSPLASFRYLITDMDGVLWRGRDPLPGLVEFFQFLRRCEIRFVCATNNASTLPEKLAERLQGWGADVTPAEIVTSSSATAEYLANTLPAGSRLYVVGMEGLRVPLLQKGFELAEDGVAAVVAGIDWHLTYDHLKRAALNIRAGARFIGTNGDRTFPSSEGIIPGAGAILAAIETGTGVKPIVMGKPEAYLYETALNRMQAVPEQTLVLGDRLETDILGAVRLGLKSVLVLSGVTTREQLAASDYQPDWVFDDITDLQAHWDRD